ncbi:hypothetical protein RYX45_14405 [Alkalihalophilus pseudofirmus]|uniref:Uncharacterized protein n=1 Tax=Alkalihalophilus pseudofirmus TaxID=79885 RepID=A0AAJ2NQ12_ALKPS|nr:hypothetical protein [Alkalihalophilus pseudofirmus]MDV2886378.1 hypothetical protein [Alkalihalophilus pseudofirmus]
MIDFTFTPSSKAEQLYKKVLNSNDLEITYTSCAYEDALYHNMIRALIDIEKSLEVDNAKLASVKEMFSEFRGTKRDKKEEILQRIDWVQSLYKAKENIESIESLEEAKQFRRIISGVQTCPMKQQLMAKIVELEQSLSQPDLIPTEISSEQRLMAKAGEEAGDVFINLGKVGREFVITDVIRQFGESASLVNVKEIAEGLEQRVKALSEETNKNKLLMKLEQLPLASFVELNKDRKEVIVERLIKQSKWSGLATLDRQITQVDRSIAKEEQEKSEDENTFLTNDGKVAYTLCIDEDDSEFIKYN